MTKRIGLLKQIVKIRWPIPLEKNIVFSRGPVILQKALSVRWSVAAWVTLKLESVKHTFMMCVCVRASVFDCVRW